MKQMTFRYSKELTRYAELVKKVSMVSLVDDPLHTLYYSLDFALVSKKENDYKVSSQR